MEYENSEKSREEEVINETEESVAEENTPEKKPAKAPALTLDNPAIKNTLNTLKGFFSKNTEKQWDLQPRVKVWNGLY